MKIVQIGVFPSSTGLVAGGIEASVSGLSREQARNHSVTVIDVPRLGGEDAVDYQENLTIYRFRNRGRHNEEAYRRAKDIAKLIVSLSPDICHLHGTGRFSREMYALLLEEKIPTVLTVHGLAAIEKRKSLAAHFSWKGVYQYLRQSRSEKALLKMASPLIVDTRYVAETLVTSYGVSRSNVAVIPQGIDDRYFHVSCSAHTRMILSVGAFTVRKGHLLLVKAFESLMQHLPDVTLVICGTISDRKYHEELSAYVSNSPCRARITMLGDLPSEDLKRLYAQAELFALHSHEESQGIVFAEAMAAGLPVVATNVGGIPDVVEQETCGLLTAFGDIDAFAKAMLRLLTDDKRWLRMSQAAKIRAQEYAWSLIAKGVESVYHSAM